MFADAPPPIVFCWLLAAAAAAAAASPEARARVRDFQPVVFEDGANEQRFHVAADDPLPGGKPCCGLPSSSSTVDPYEFEYDSRNPREIPLSVIMKLNQVSNVSELFNKFMPDVNMREAQHLIAPTGLKSRTVQNLERKAVVIPKLAGCSVELTSISLRNTEDSSLFHYPWCTRVYRCGGCCANDVLLTCRPTKTETLNLEIMVSQYVGAGKLKFLGKKTVPVTQHLECKCGCVIQEKDCNHLQTYNPSDCLCMCNNEEDREKCNEEHVLKFWDSTSCSCQCRNRQECTTGFEFDSNTCRCEVLRGKTKVTGYDFNRNVYSLAGEQ